MKLRATVVVEYDADPRDYDTDDPATAATIDEQQFDDDLSTLVYVIETGGGYRVTVEPVAENDPTKEAPMGTTTSALGGERKHG